MPAQTLFLFVFRLFALNSVVTWAFDALRNSSSMGEASQAEILYFSIAGILQVGFAWWLFVKAGNICTRLKLDRGFDAPLVVAKLNKKTVLHIALITLGGYLCVDAVTESLMIVQNYFTMHASPIRAAVNVTGDGQLRTDLLTQPVYFIFGYVVMTNAYRIAPYLLTLKSDNSSD